MTKNTPFLEKNTILPNFSIIFSWFSQCIFYAWHEYQQRWTHWEKSWENFSQNLCFSPNFGKKFSKWAIFSQIVWLSDDFRKICSFWEKFPNFREKHKFWEKISHDFSQCRAECYMKGPQVQMTREYMSHGCMMT